jgi:hypothetical protein
VEKRSALGQRISALDENGFTPDTLAAEYTIILKKQVSIKLTVKSKSDCKMRISKTMRSESMFVRKMNVAAMMKASKFTLNVSSRRLIAFWLLPAENMPHKTYESAQLAAPIPRRKNVLGGRPRSSS